MTYLPVSILHSLAEDLSLLLGAPPVSYNQPHEILAQVFCLLFRFKNVIGLHQSNNTSASTYS